MTGALSGMIGSMKGATAPTTAPTSLSAIPTNTNVAISFTNPSNDGGSPITNYEYSFNNSSWTALSPADAISPITVSGLTQNTAYSIYLRAVNIVGSGPASSAVTFTTAGIPTGTTTISSVSVTDTVATVNFSTTAGGGAITGYDYYLTSWVDAATSTSPKVISGLTQNTGYTVYMRPKNAYGTGSQSAGFGFTTAGVPTGAATISSVTVGTTTATVNFSVAAGGGAITGYDLYVANQTNAWNNTTGSPISVTGLTANSYYAFYVRAKNAYGVGPQSAGVGATTINSTTTVQYLVVAGGGGSGGASTSYWSGGGGGAGGYRSSVTGESTGRGGALEGALGIAIGSSIAVAIGGGGGGGWGGGGGDAGRGGSGGTSTFSSISSTGGGAGGAGSATGGAALGGGAGGGSANAGSVGVGAGTSGQGFDGRSGPTYYSGGGGGAGAGGGTSQYGGTGVASGITGTSTYRAGGGGGAFNQPSGGVNTSSSGGGGAGGTGRDSQGVAGTTNTGGGGGAPNCYQTGHGGNNGGSGIVIIRYPDTQPNLSSIGAGLTKTGGGLTPTVTTGGYKVYEFTNGSGNIGF